MQSRKIPNPRIVNIDEIHLDANQNNAHDSLDDLFSDDVHLERPAAENNAQPQPPVPANNHVPSVQSGEEDFDFGSED